MKRALTVSLLIAASVVASSCAQSGPVTLSLASSQSRTGEVRMESDAAFSEPASLPVEITYSVKEAFPIFPDRLLAWSIGRRVKPSGEARKLAASFGVFGELDKVNDNLYLISDTVNNHSVSLWVDEAGGWWTYSRNSATSGSGVSSSPCVPGKSCDQSGAATTPASLIQPGEAIRRTNQYLSRADMVPLNYPLKASQSLSSTDVFGALTLGGVETNVGVSFTYGDKGALISASGPMISIAMAGRYPIITPDEAVKRLNDRKYSAFGPAARAVADTAVSSSASPSPSSAISSTIDVPITSVRLILMEARLSNGTHMLLPAYVFSNADGDVGTALAVSDDRLSFRQSVTTSSTVAMPEPAEPMPGSPDSPGVLGQQEANSLVGLTELEATATAREKGWVVRIAARDGEYFMLTSDYITNRVNLVIEKNLVTSVAVG